MTSINQDSLYLTAPVSYLNMKRSSYSRILSFRFKVADTANMQFTKDDIMLVSKSKDGLKISTSLTGQGKFLTNRLIFDLGKSRQKRKFPERTF